MNGTIRVRAILGALALLVASLALATPARATTEHGVNATPYNATDHPWTSDGCSWVPDSGVTAGLATVGTPPWSVNIVVVASWDFNHACVHHDGCYRGHWADRATCDQWFRNDMNASCDAMHADAAKRSVCKQQATLYYTGVRLLGGGAFTSWSHLIAMA